MFLGTPKIAVPALEALVASRHEIVLVISRPSRPAGRHRELREPPLIAAAKQIGLDTVQPAKAREAVPTIVERGADVCAIVAYGGWLPAVVLDATQFGCVNVHPSMLPRWRGAAPVEWTLISGDSVTGVSTMQVDEGLDTGPILLQADAEVRSDDTAGVLKERLAPIGARLLVETLDALDSGDIEPVAQTADGATYANKLETENCVVDWTESAYAVDCLIRGANPRPGAWTTVEGKRLKLWMSYLVGSESDLGESDLMPGAVVSANPLDVVAGDGRVVRLVEVQPEGRQRMGADAYARGHDLAGVRLGS